MNSWKSLGNTWQTVMLSAVEAYLKNSIPIGAAIVDNNGAVVSIGRNGLTHDRIAHAETEALRSAPAGLDRKNASIYSSMEPCPMCTGAIRLMQLKTLYMAARDPAAGSTELLSATKFMRHFECQVVAPANPTLEFVNVAILIEYRTRNDHQRWREDWYVYHPLAVEIGEEMASSGIYESWIARDCSAQEIYEIVASYFR